MAFRRKINEISLKNKRKFVKFKNICGQIIRGAHACGGRGRLWWHVRGGGGGGCEWEELDGGTPQPGHVPLLPLHPDAGPGSQHQLPPRIRQRGSGKGAWLPCSCDTVLQSDSRRSLVFVGGLVRRRLRDEGDSVRHYKPFFPFFFLWGVALKGSLWFGFQ